MTSFSTPLTSDKYHAQHWQAFRFSLLQWTQTKALLFLYFLDPLIMAFYYFLVLLQSWLNKLGLL